MEVGYDFVSLTAMISSTTIVKGTTISFTKSEVTSSEYSFVDLTESHQLTSDTTHDHILGYGCFT